MPKEPQDNQNVSKSVRKRRDRGGGTVIALPNGQFRVQISTGVDASGKRGRLTKVFGTKRDALAWLRERQHEQNRGILAHSGQTTLGEWLDRWIEMRRADTADTTYAQYGGHVRIHLKPHLGAYRLSDLKPLHISAAYQAMEAAGVSAATRFKIATTLRTALKSAIEVGLLSVNPATKIKKPKVQRPRFEAWTREEAIAFMASFTPKDVQPLALFSLALDSGMRQGELLGLHWPQVDFDSGAVQVVQSLQELEGVFKLKDVKRDSSRRRIRITPGTIEALRIHREAMRKAGADAERGPVFISSRDGGYLSKTAAAHQFHRRIKSAKVRKIRFHDIRHTMATLLLLDNVNVKAVSSRLGHASIQITLDTYAHVLPQMEEQIVASLRGMFSR